MSTFGAIRSKAGRSKRPPRTMRVLPHAEGLVDGAEGVDLELVVAVLARHEQLDVVVVPDEAVALGERRAHLRLLDPVARRRSARRPTGRRRAFVERGLAAHHVDEARRARGTAPGGLVEVAVDGEAAFRPRAIDVRQTLFADTVAHGVPDLGGSSGRARRPRVADAGRSRGARARGAPGGPRHTLPDSIDFITAIVWTNGPARRTLEGEEATCPRRTRPATTWWRATSTRR